VLVHEKHICLKDITMTTSGDFWTVLGPTWGVPALHNLKTFEAVWLRWARKLEKAVLVKQEMGWIRKDLGLFTPETEIGFVSTYSFFV
jgi:hypothetical protein